MNAVCMFCTRFSRWRLLILPLLFLMGCSTTPKIDWAGRIGIYTLDQAILDFGPPDREARLTDGTVVAEWLTGRGWQRGYAAPNLGYPYGMWPPYPAYFESYTPDRFLRLVFGPDGRLKDWRSFYK